jgi:hypothetical protein
MTEEGRKNRQQDRDQEGRYTFDGNLDRLCVCGHTLGHHSGGAPHDCLVYSFPKGDPNKAECDCPKFRLSRRKSK